MTRWFTADEHFDHDNIIKFCNRPFKDRGHMNEEVISRHNLVVDENDEVWILGDFTLAGKERARQLLGRLKGEIHIVPGGHDSWIKKDEVYLSGIDTGKTRRVVIEPPIVILRVPERKLNKHTVTLTLCHYPMRSWERSHYGMPHIYGHVHNTWRDVRPSGDVLMPPGLTQGKSMDIGVDAHGFYPISLEQVLAQLVDS